MKRTITFLYLLSIAFLIDSPMFAQEDFSKEIIVYFKTGAQKIAQTTQTNIDAINIREVLQKYNVRSEDVIVAFPDFIKSDTVKISPNGNKVDKPNWAKIFKIRITGVTIRDSLIHDLKRLPNVLFAEPNGTAEMQTIPNDQYFSKQWNLHNTGQYNGTPNADIHAPEAWDLFTGSSQRKIAIIDNGIDASHPDLLGKVTGDATYSDDHGTHVAGIAAAKTNNSIGISGVDWNTGIISEDISRQDVPGISSKIQSAVDAGADVLNCSWTLSIGYSLTVRLAFSYGYKLNCVATAAMGNYNSSNPYYPAAFGQGIIAVGATTIIDTRSPYSNYGNHIDVCAPGGSTEQVEHEIYSTISGGGYTYGWGTSMAAPQVSGLASLLKGYNSNLYNDDIEHIIQLSADKIHTYIYS